MRLSLIFIVMFSFFFVLGCSSSKKDKKRPTKANVEAPEAADDGKSDTDDSAPADVEPMDHDEARDELVGIWRVRLSALAEDPELKKLDEVDREKALETAQQMVGNLAFEFTPDGKMNLYMGDKVRAGTYSILETTGDVITLKTSHGSGQDAEVENVEVVVADDTLKVTGEDGKQTLVLERGPPGKNTGGAPENGTEAGNAEPTVK